MTDASKEILVIYWEWSEETKYAGSRFWGAHSVENDGRIADWPKMGMRPIGAGKVIVQEGEGLHLLDGSLPPPQT
ncbi:MAG: hypothetical protein ACOH2J_18285, partial [Allorhizobium sp.]